MKGINTIEIVNTSYDKRYPEIEINFRGPQFNNTCDIKEFNIDRYNIEKFIKKLEITPAEIKYIKTMANDLVYDKDHNLIEINLKNKTVRRYNCSIG